MITLSSEFKLRTEPLSRLVVSTLSGSMTVNVFRVRFSKALIECFNKSSNPKNMYDDLMSLNIYYSLISQNLKYWKDTFAHVDEQSKERDEDKRFLTTADKVFGIEPNAKTVPVIKEMLK